MKIEHILLIKSTVWESLSALLGFTVVFLYMEYRGKYTSPLQTSIEITLILLALKSVLLAIYDYHAHKLIKKLRNNER